MLKVDATRTARSHAERVTLIEAVANAPVIEQETDWIEWKSELDITKSEGSFKVARSILGFGNRNPTHAENVARGCAYFLVGVEPGSLSGTSVHDSADVEQWIGRYVAHGKPQWSVDFLELRGKTVMLVTVEAPRWGDPIFTLQRGIGRDKAGDIFVRLNGKTEHARPQDVERLTDRAKQADQRVNVEVVWRGKPSLRPIALSESDVAAWAEEQLEPLRSKPQPAGNWHPLLGAVYDSTLLLEMRTPAEYTDEVAAYTEHVRDRYELIARWGAVNHRLAPIDLAISNPTDINFPRTEVTLRLPGDVFAYFDTDPLESELAEIEPPKPWGSHTLSVAPIARIPNIRLQINPDGRRICREADEVMVTLPPIDVRPGTRHDLQPVYLVIPEECASKALEIRWRATSTGADGHREGVLEAEVGDPVDAELLVAVYEEDE